MIDEQRLEALASVGDNAAWVELLRLRVRRGEDVLAPLREATAGTALDDCFLYPDFCWPEHLRGIPLDLACILHRAEQNIRTINTTAKSAHGYSVWVPRKSRRQPGFSIKVSCVGVYGPAHSSNGQFVNVGKVYLSTSNKGRRSDYRSNRTHQLTQITPIVLGALKTMVGITP